MIVENSIRIHAPIETIFAAAADLSLWPSFLPHYRWVRYISRTPTFTVVQMAARRSWIPIRWTSEQEIDQLKREIRFHHLKSFTKGMRVVWSFTQTEDGVVVRICHELKPQRKLIGGAVTTKIIGQFFIHHVAGQTLAHFKKHLEGKDA